MTYLWVKAFHVIAMVAWFSGLFYVPRLFVYHAQAPADDVIGRERFKIMERRLYYGITTPAGILTVVLGLWLWLTNFEVFSHFLWLHVKLGLVLILIAYHAYLGILLRDFKYDNNRHTPTFYRWLNEFPVFVLIPVVLLVILKPAWTA